MWKGRNHIAIGVVESAASLGAIIFTLCCGSSYGQKAFEAKGFKLADYYPAPHETQMKSLLEGAKARPEGEGRLLLTDVKLQTFHETGERELQVQAPDCLYQTTAKTASSSGPLRVQTADGKFSIEGEGFLWQQTNSSLSISNHVHTVVHPSLLESASAKAEGQPEALPTGSIDIFSDRFDYGQDNGLAVYQGNTRVSGTNLNLTGGCLTVRLPMEERQLQSILVETNVVADYGEVHATGQRAVYSVTNGLVRVSGQPTWRAEQREGHGNELVIDRTNRIFQANGNAWLKLAGQSLGASGFLARSNAPSAAVTTNRFVAVSSDSYEIRTNGAVFRDHVRLAENIDGSDRGKMRSDLLTAHFSGSNQLQRLVAERNVVIEQETNRFTGGRAVYTGTNGVLEMTESPTWQAGLRQGKGELLRLDTQKEELLVRGKASLRMPAAELAEITTTAPETPPKPRDKGAGAEVAEIFCNEYTLRPDLGVFRGRVYATHPQMNWACETLTVRSTPGRSQVDNVTAEQGVIFDLTNEKGEKVHGKGDKAVYTYSVHGNVTNDVLNLTGSPATLETTNWTMQNKLIILDRTHNSLVAPGGDYQVRGTAKGVDTNLFRPRITK